MKSFKSSYYTFNEKGETNFPTKFELEENVKNKLESVLILDSCVCLELVKFADYKNKANVDKEKLIHFLEYIHKNKIEIKSFLGIMELCHDPKTMNFNLNKFEDFKNRIDFLEQIPLKYIHLGQFDYSYDYTIIGNIGFKQNSLSSFKPLLLTSYCCLLKIRELSLKGLKQKDAKKNLEYYLDWSINQLDRIMGIEIQLAINIFGGGSNYRKMIGVDINQAQNEIKRILWATSWDFFHARISCNNLKMSKNIGKDINSTFVTKDFNLFKLISQLSLTIIFENSMKSISTNLLMGTFDLPHFDDDYIDTLNKKSLDLLTDRVNLEKHYNENKLMQMILELEKTNNIS